MNDFNAELTALKRILSSKKTYRETVFNIFVQEKLSAKDFKELKLITYSILRRYFSLSYEASSLFPEIRKDDDEFYFILLLLFYLRYDLKTDKIILREKFLNTFNSFRLYGDFNYIYDKVAKKTERNFTIPENLKDKPYTYNSLVLEVPEFLLKKIVDFYGAKKASEILKHIHDIPRLYCAINKNKTNITLNYEKEHLSYADIYQIPKDHDLKKDPLYQEGKIYTIDYLKALAIKDVFIKPLSFKALLLNQRTPYLSAYLEEIIKDHEEKEITAHYLSSARYRMALDLKEKFNCQISSPLLSSLPLVKTFVKEDYYDLVFLQARDTNLGKAGSRIDIIANLNEKDIYNHSLSEKSDLLAASDFVKLGGDLVYLTFSLLQEETFAIKDDFLKMRKNFAFVKDNFLFPKDKNTESGYYAIFRRIR